MRDHIFHKVICENLLFFSKSHKNLFASIKTSLGNHAILATSIQYDFLILQGIIFLKNTILSSFSHTATEKFFTHDNDFDLSLNS